MPQRVAHWCLNAFAGALFFFALGVITAQARPHQDPVLALSANDAPLQVAICRLGPTVLPEEAAEVTRCAFETGRELRQKWAVVWPPGLQNFLIHRGVKKGGLCFQWAEELLVRLHLLKLQSIELHWAEANIHSDSEHNVIVVTAKGQPFSQGVLLDNWRYGGRLAWGPVRGDAQYPWRENPAHFAYVLNEKFRARTHLSPRRPAKEESASVPITAAQQSELR